MLRLMNRRRNNSEILPEHAAEVQQKGWAVNIEFTDDPHPRNNFWEMWGLPMFNYAKRSRRRDSAGRILQQISLRLGESVKR